MALMGVNTYKKIKITKALQIDKKKLVFGSTLGIGYFLFS